MEQDSLAICQRDDYRHHPMALPVSARLEIECFRRVRFSGRNRSNVKYVSASKRFRPLKRTLHILRKIARPFKIQPPLKTKATMIAKCLTPLIALFTYAIGLPALLAADLPVTGHDDPRLATFDRTMLKFMVDHDVPGGALAIARHGKIVYARGFGYSDIANHTPVDPDALFRIASVSKPFTSAAILQLVERGHLKLTDHPFEMLAFKPHLENNAQVDPRLSTITIHQLLHHTGGFDRSASFDPMFRPIDIAKAVGTKPPAGPSEIIEYMMGRSLDFAPGTKEAYSNFGYCVLGRLIEKVSGMPYVTYVQKEVLGPLGIHRMRLGRSLEAVV